QAELREQALSDNGSLNLTGSTLELSLLNLKSSQSSFLPQINYTASYGYDQTARDWDIGLDNSNSALTHNFSLSWNLFNGGNKKTQVQNAKINVKNAELRQADMRLNIERDVASYHSAYENSLITLESELKTLEFAELNFDRTREMFRLGQITALQYREAQLNLVRTKLAITRARYAARLYELKLLQLGGRLL
ncbi:MAG: TolC family protein, partial [Candidatus Neomarinimicrobiota bacterium]